MDLEFFFPKLKVSFSYEKTETVKKINHYIESEMSKVVFNWYFNSFAYVVFKLKIMCTIEHKDIGEMGQTYLHNVEKMKTTCLLLLIYFCKAIMFIFC